MLDKQKYTTQFSLESAKELIDSVDVARSLFQTDTLAQAQYLDATHRKRDLPPEKRLMLAILDDAVSCFQDNLLAQGGRAKKLFVDAEAWIFQSDTAWPFSFESICDALDLDAEYIRGGLVRSKRLKCAQSSKRIVNRVASRVL